MIISQKSNLQKSQKSLQLYYIWPLNILITVQQAKNLILQHSEVLETIEISLANALGDTLANDLKATLNLPSFRQSAMDGYAVYWTNNEETEFKLIGEAAAGSSNIFTLQPGEAVRIFTGAPVPDTANVVIMQEWIKPKVKDVICLNEAAKKVALGMNIRREGEQIKVGEVALKKGTTLNPAGIGFLQSFGYEKVRVFRKPTVVLVVTGNELVQPGNDLEFGQIYESNSITLKTALNDAGFEVSEILFAKDSLAETVAQIKKAKQAADTVLISGGISVGDYDFVETALKQLEVEQVFYKIAQKPGKPLFFGKSNNQLFFGLPGNPASALVCLYEYVIPALKKQSGNTTCMPISVKLPSKDDFIIRGNRDLFLKGRIKNNTVAILDKQASFMLQSFAHANALVYIPWKNGNINKNDLVEVHLL